MKIIKVNTVLLFLLLQVGFVLQANGATFEIFPPATSDCNEEFENIANTLKPGDTLIVHGGTYSQSCRRAITVNGTADLPITIRAADGESPLLTRPADNIDTQNNIEIVNSSYLTIRGLRFQGGSTGVRFVGGHHITLEDLEIYETGNNAIALNSGNSEALIFRRNHIHHTGLSTSGTTEGEGMYVGCNNNSCRVINSLIEGNYIHHLRATSEGGNDGIEVKVGSYGNIIRNNVIHDTNIEMKFPCIFVYGGGNSVNTVEGNVVWNCGEAIQVVSDAIVRNNIVLNSASVGITASPHSQVAQMRNVTIVNNTIYGHPKCLLIRWSGATNMVLANNAIYCPTNTAVDASGLSGAGITTKANYVEGTLTGVSLDNVRFFPGGNATAVFRDPGGKDLWPLPNSVLIGKADASVIPAADFNETPRTAPHDIGAYETEGLSSNPGWKVTPGFKQTVADSTPPAAPKNLEVR